jgi:hypothetical protein
MDDSRNDSTCVFTALMVPGKQWHASLDAVMAFRRELRADYGIYTRKELHAHKFVNGRGRIADRTVTKSQRFGVFETTLRMMTELPGARLINAVYHRKAHRHAYSGILNRVNRTMERHKSYAVLVCDKGNEAEYTRLARKMSRYNPIPSDRGNWQESGKPWKNIPLARVVEDPVFKDSEASLFIQLVDFAAYALLNRECPLPSKTRFGLHKSFFILEPMLLKQASRFDDYGIVRPRQERSPSANREA